MAHEFYLQFSDPDWYPKHRGDLRAQVHGLPSLAREATERELWLKASDSPGTWSYDIRMFLDPRSVLVEVTTFGTAYFRGLKNLLAALPPRARPQLVDEDGVPVQW